MTDAKTSLDALLEGLVTERSGLAYTQRVMAKMYGDAAQGLGFSSTLFARDIINQAVANIQGEFTKEMTQFAEAMATKAGRNRDGRVTRIHELAGQAAVSATVRSYERTRAKRRKAARLIQNPAGTVGNRKDPTRFQAEIDPAFERANRFANGKLSRALASPNMFDARWDGVAFINRSWLDRNAAQWYRLSFGAGQRGLNGPRHRTYNVNFFGQSAFSMSLAGFKPSASFSMPAGIWFDFEQQGGLENAKTSPLDEKNRKRPGEPNPARRGLDQFMPGSFGGKAFKGRRTAGIEGTAYLDAGVNALTNELGRGWSVLMTEWFEEAATQDTGPIASAGVTPETAAIAAARLKGALSDMRIQASAYKSTLSL
jgi:hypothetical protein